SQNGKIEFVPPGPEERGVAPEFVIWIGGFWAIIENADREIHFFELRGNRFLRAGSAPFPATGYVTEIVSVSQQNLIRVRLADNRTQDIDVSLPTRRAGSESLSADIAITAEAPFTGQPANRGAVTFKVPGRSQQRSSGGPESLTRFSELNFTLQP